MEFTLTVEPKIDQPDETCEIAKQVPARQSPTMEEFCEYFRLLKKAVDYRKQVPGLTSLLGYVFKEENAYHLTKIIDCPNPKSE